MEPEPLAAESDRGEAADLQVRLQGHTVLSDLDVVGEAGGALRGYSAEFTTTAEDVLTVELSGTDGSGAPILSGLSVVRVD